MEQRIVNENEGKDGGAAGSEVRTVIPVSSVHKRFREESEGKTLLDTIVQVRQSLGWAADSEERHGKSARKQSQRGAGLKHI